MAKNNSIVLVLGANGMAGSMISNYLLSTNKYEIHTFDLIKPKYGNAVAGDALDFDNLEKIIHDIQPNTIINCIGILNQYAENNKLSAILLNSYLPHYLAKMSLNLGYKIIHLSTDCVFSGIKGSPYSVADLKDGSSFYDISKSLGELYYDNHLTFRNSIIGPDTNETGIGLFNWFMNRTEKTFGYSEAIWGGITTLTLAKAIDAAIDQDLCGLYQLSNNTEISKLSLLSIINEVFDKRIELVPAKSVKYNKSLFSSMGEFKFHVPSYREMIEELKVWIDMNIDLYPHYSKEEV
jgi:dTDP-4-dehydrorhamnose reductase